MQGLPVAFQRKLQTLKAQPGRSGQGLMVQQVEGGVAEEFQFLGLGKELDLARMSQLKGRIACGLQKGAVCGGESRVYFETILSEDEIFIFGAGHVGKALARVAHLITFYLLSITQK